MNHNDTHSHGKTRDLSFKFFIDSFAAHYRFIVAYNILIQENHFGTFLYWNTALWKKSPDLWSPLPKRNIYLYGDDSLITSKINYQDMKFPSKLH